LAIPWKQRVNDSYVIFASAGIFYRVIPVNLAKMGPSHASARAKDEEMRFTSEVSEFI
jgi:hypothetical protein